MNQTRIEWTEYSWNPITGCTPVSEGCEHCYAKTMALRLQKMGVEKYSNGFEVTIHEKEFHEPEKWKEPKKIFVCSMSDFLHRCVSVATILDLLAIMAKAKQHTFQILTKRPERMVQIISAYEIVLSDNIWFGVTAENQQRAEERLSYLMYIPAKVKYVSCEPLLGPIDLKEWLSDLQWVIAGSETGRGARWADVSWFRSLRDQCQEAKVPFFLKQLQGAGNNKIRELDGVIHDGVPMLGK